MLLLSFVTKVHSNRYEEVIFTSLDIYTVWCICSKIKLNMTINVIVGYNDSMDIFYLIQCQANTFSFNLCFSELLHYYFSYTIPWTTTFVLALRSSSMNMSIAAGHLFCINCSHHSLFCIKNITCSALNSNTAWDNRSTLGSNQQIWVSPFKKIKNNTEIKHIKLCGFKNIT